MKKIMPLLLAGFTAGCTHAKESAERLDTLVGQAVSLATGPCAQKLAETASTCKTQYPNLPW